MKLFDRLKQPYPFSNGFWESIITIFLISIFITAFVLLFNSNSFGFSSFDDRFMVSLGFGAITFVGATFNIVLATLLFSQKTKENWNVMNEIFIYVAHVAIITFGNIVYSHIIMHNPYNWMFIAQSTFYTLCIAAIPISVFVLFQYNSLLKKSMNEAMRLNEDATNFKNKIQTKNHEVIEFSSDATLSVNEILFIESDKNYVKVALNEGKEIRIRSTLKDMEDKLSKMSDFVRTHKAFIVNISKVSNIEGNAQGLKIQLFDCAHLVPVSRTYIPKIKELFETYRLN